MSRICLLIGLVFGIAAAGTLHGQEASDSQDSLVVSAEAFESVPGVEGSPEPMGLAKFDVAKTVERVKRETGWGQAEINSWLTTNVNSLLHTGGEHELLQAEKVQMPDGNEELMVVSENGCGSLLAENTLLVRATESKVADVQGFLRRIQETGVRQVMVRVNVFSGPAEDVKRLPVAWSHVATQSQIGAASVEVKSASGSLSSDQLPASAQENRIAAMYARSNGVFRASFERHQEQVNASKLLPPPGTENSTWVNATSVIERATPVLYTLLSPQELEKLLELADGSEGVVKERSPSVGVYDGNTATINNIVERPLVVGIDAKAAGEADNRKVMFLPRTRVYPHGDSLTLRPQIIGGHQVRLACNAEDFSIRKIDTLDFPTADGARTLRVQLPEVGHTRFQTQIDIPLGFALAIYTADTIDGEAVGKLRILTCAVKDVEQNER